MALVVYVNGRREIVEAMIGAQIWKVLNGEIDPTPEEEKQCENIKRVYLNWRNAPDSYIKAYFDVIMSSALAEWQLETITSGGDRIVTGKVSRPQPHDDFAWEFAKRWGLWLEGKKTELADKYHKPLEKSQTSKSS